MKKIILMLISIILLTACKKDNIVKIVDKTLEMENFTCAHALEEFYKDDVNTYYFQCNKSDYVVVIYESGKEKTVKEALKDKEITINDLEKYSINFYWAANE